VRFADSDTEAVAMSDDAVARIPDLSSVRTRRAHLRRASAELEVRLAAPMRGGAPTWADGVAPAVSELGRAWATHVMLTESRGGLFDQIIADAPRLVSAVSRLLREHQDIATELGSAELQLQAGEEGTLEGIRDALTALLATVSRHRQQGADLIYQAYQIDIGGE
jgi:hypothetical protein